MYFGAGVGKLEHTRKSLLVSWERTEDEWRDQVREEIGSQHIEPLLEQMEVALREMNQLAELFGRIYRECS